jgi:dihydrofolate reductase
VRKLFAFNMVTLDGYFEGSDGEIDWHNADNKEFNEFAVEQMSTVDTLAFGRKTYQMMASYWLTEVAMQSDPIVADRMNCLSKVVFSTTLEAVDWNNTRLVSENAAQELRTLKSQAGKDLAIFGSADLISTIMEEIDEHRVMVNPVLLGQGTPLFRSTGKKILLKRVNARAFESGNVLLTYRPAEVQA